MERPWELYPFHRDNPIGGIHLMHEPGQSKYNKLVDALDVLIIIFSMSRERRTLGILFLHKSQEQCTARNLV